MGIFNTKHDQRLRPKKKQTQKTIASQRVCVKRPLKRFVCFSFSSFYFVFFFRIKKIITKSRFLKKKLQVIIIKFPNQTLVHCLTAKTQNNTQHLDFTILVIISFLKPQKNFENFCVEISCLSYNQLPTHFLALIL